MKKTYLYSLLQYRHSIVLGEVLNIGLLVYFPLENKIQFIYPDSFERIKKVYKDFPENSITSYFEYFNKKVDELNENSDIFYRYEIKKNLKSLVEGEFLSEDSSILQFSNHNKAILYNENIFFLLDKLSKFYFPSDSVRLIDELVDINRKARKKEDWIKPDIKNKIVKIDKDFIYLPNKNELSF